MSGTPKFSLSFSKKIEKKNLNPSVIRNDGPQEQKESTLLIESIEENKIKGDEKVEEELVIPMIELDRGAIFKKLSEKAQKRKLLEEIENDDNISEKTEFISTSDNKEIDSNEKALTLEEQAEAAIIEESKQGIEKWENRSQKNNLTIPVGMPSEEESLTAIGKESNLDDYDQVGVDHFGSALLRGMGWKKKEGIGGKTGKQVVEIVEPTARQFGQIVTKGKETSESCKNEEMELKKGSCIFIHSGRSRGSYGTVESVDEDHILVRRTMVNDVVREVELNVRVVTQKEFKDSSRVINKEMYDEYKSKEGIKGKVEKEKTEDKCENKKNKDEDQHENVSEGKSIHEKYITNKESTYSKQGSSSDKNEYTRQIEKIKELKGQQNENYEDDSNKSNKEKNFGNAYDKISQTKNPTSYKEVLEDRKDKFKEVQDRSKYLTNDDVNHYKKDYKDYEDRKYKERKDKSCYSKNEYKDYYKESSERKYIIDSMNKKDKFCKEGVKDKYEKYEGKRSGYDNEYREMKKHKVEKMPEMPWVRENLRVRLINKSFKGGKYHKEKVVVCNIETVESCECITDDGRILRDVNPAWLETVIPKQPPQIVMIVKGQQKGQKGRILELHKSQECASIQILDDDKDIVKLHYDNICEYVRR